MTSSIAPDENKRPLAGASAWLITAGMAGMDVQVKGVAEALGLNYEMKHVAPKGIWRLMSPWGPLPPADRFGKPGSQFAPPWPDVVISLGRIGAPYLREVRRRAGPATFTLAMQDAKAGLSFSDVIWVSEHDRLRGPNVITTLLSPHGFTPERIAALRREMPADIAALPGPRVAVIVGGKNAVYKWLDTDYARFERALNSIGQLGASFLVTPSRRTQEPLLEVIDRATRPFPRILYDLTGPNPYGDFLAHADLFVVTGDSVNMTGEACATGRPVFVFTPSGGSAKFARYHEALEARGATRPLPDRLEALPQWSYEPMFSAQDIAREFERRWLAHKAQQANRL